MTHYLVIDVEASGRNLIENFMPCFGAVVIDGAQNKVIEEDDRFMVYVRPPHGTGWDTFCVKNFWKRDANKEFYEKVLRELASPTCPTPDEAMYMFVSWARRMARRYKNLVLMTDTAGFDLAWMNIYLSMYHDCVPSMNYLFGRYMPILDTNSYIMGLARRMPEEGLWGVEKAALKALDREEMPEMHVSHDHNPVHDAEHNGIVTAFFVNQFRKFEK